MTIKSGKKKNNNGAAMMLTIIIIAVLIVFAFSLILISYNLYASQNKNLSSDRNAEAANSLARAIEKELTDPDAIKNSNLWKYLRFNIAYCNGGEEEGVTFKDWTYYDASDYRHDEDYAKRYFKLDRNTAMEGMPADVSICMYWKLPDGVGEDILDINLNRNGIVLYVEIKCSTGGQTYKIVDTYTLTVVGTDDAAEITKINEVNNSVSNPADHVVNTGEKWIWKHETRD